MIETVQPVTVTKDFPKNRIGFIINKIATMLSVLQEHIDA
jgi:hypothetical protein